MEGFQEISDANINISDVLDAIETTDPSFAEQNRSPENIVTLQPATRVTRSQTSSGSQVQRQQQQMDVSENLQPQPLMSGPNRPSIQIIEQPASKALRFRYECEGRSAGSIPGANSTNENKTYPGIRINNYKGPVVVVVSCVTKEAPYRPHPHNLVGKDVCKDGVCTVQVKPSDNMTVYFDKLGIQCVKKREIEAALTLRESNHVDPFRTGFDHKRNPTNIDLNSVRLCFQAFIQAPGSKRFTVPLPPQVSNAIYDKKANSDLTICNLSHCSASVAGGTEIILLCEKVTKEDIEVVFYAERNGVKYWEGKGDFLPANVHKQVAISLRTPSFSSQQIDEPVDAFIMLRRPSDDATSLPRNFQFLPIGLDDPERRRNKRPRLSPNAYLLKHVQAETKRNSTRRTIGSSESPGTSQQMTAPQFELNIVKTEPTDRLSPFGGHLVTSAPSPPMFQTGNLNATQFDQMGGFRSINSPSRSPNPMDMYNIPFTPLQQTLQSPLNEACQLQPIPSPDPAMNIFVQDDLLQNNLAMGPQNNFNQLGDSDFVSGVIGIARNVLDEPQQTTELNGFNLTQFNRNLNICEDPQVGMNGDIAAGTAEESSMTDSFDTILKKTVQEMSTYNNFMS